MSSNYESSAFSEIGVSVTGSLSGLNTATGTLTSSITNDNKIESIIISANYTNFASCDLGNSLIDELILKDNYREEVNVSLTSTTIKNLITTLPSNFNPLNNYVNGFSYNIKNLYNFLGLFINGQDAYGSNSTVSYYGTYFPKITSNKSSKLFPLVEIGPNDYILYDITVPDEKWQSSHNVFNITPYFFSYTTDEVVTDVWASTDITIPLFNEFKTPGNRIKICITSSKNVGDEFKKYGWIISKIPVEYLNSTTFFPFIRLGSTTDNDPVDINTYVKSYYYKSDNTSSINNYTSKDIILELPISLIPSNQTFDNNLTNFNNIVSYLNLNVCDSNLTSQTVKYFSNLYNVKYAFKSFYDSITVNPAAQLQGNNTGENYFNSNFIDLTTLTQAYIYFLALNQNTMQTGLTSNIQVYNASDYDVITNGTFNTSPSIPTMNNINYPNTFNNNLPLFYLTGLNVSQILSTGVTSIMIVERISYNPINYYQSSNDYTGKAYVLFGPQLNTDSVKYLKQNYDILISYPYD